MPDPACDSHCPLSVVLAVALASALEKCHARELNPPSELEFCFCEAGVTQSLRSHEHNFRLSAFSCHMHLRGFALSLRWLSRFGPQR